MRKKIVATISTDENIKSQYHLQSFVGSDFRIVAESNISEALTLVELALEDTPRREDVLL